MKKIIINIIIYTHIYVSIYTHTHIYENINNTQGFKYPGSSQEGSNV